MLKFIRIVSGQIARRKPRFLIHQPPAIAPALEPKAPTSPAIHAYCAMLTFSSRRKNGVTIANKTSSPSL